MVSTTAIVPIKSSYTNIDLFPGQPRYIPSDLIPIDNKSLDEEWARSTFPYARYFSNRFTSEDIQYDSDIQAWMDTAIKLQNELKEMGVNKAHEKIVNIFDEYNVKMPGTMNEGPSNFDDVIAIINDKDWYRAKQDVKRNLIHMVSYGIFRRGHNHWAIHAANEWLQKHHVRILQNRVGGTQTSKTSRHKKGFVYMNLVHRASNSIADRIQKSMASSHGEFIAVRKKTRSEKYDTYTFESVRFNQYEGYIVYPKNNLLDLMTPKEKMKKKVVDAIKLALQNTVTLDEIDEIVKHMKDGLKKNKNGT